MAIWNMMIKRWNEINIIMKFAFPFRYSSFTLNHGISGCILVYLGRQDMVMPPFPLELSLCPACQVNLSIMLIVGLVSLSLLFHFYFKFTALPAETTFVIRGTNKCSVGKQWRCKL